MILFIDLGTDIFPAVSLAYEESESFIMERKPRSRDDHLVTLKLMVNAYMTVGIMETIAAYFAFFWVFNDFGFSISDVAGTGVEFKNDWNDTSDEMKDTFTDLCNMNDVYTGDCQQGFADYR